MSQLVETHTAHGDTRGDESSLPKRVFVHEWLDGWLSESQLKRPAFAKIIHLSENAVDNYRKGRRPLDVSEVVSAMEAAVSKDLLPISALESFVRKLQASAAAREQKVLDPQADLIEVEEEFLARIRSGKGSPGAALWTFYSKATGRARFWALRALTGWEFPKEDWVQVVETILARWSDYADEILSGTSQQKGLWEKQQELQKAVRRASLYDREYWEE